MSPWGRFYLTHFSYHPEWHCPFEHWRKNWCIDHVSEQWGLRSSITSHLDKIAAQLCDS